MCLIGIEMVTQPLGQLKYVDAKYIYLALQYPLGKINSRIESVSKHLLPKKIARVYLQRLNCTLAKGGITSKVANLT